MADLLSRASYRNDRIVVLKHGKPTYVIIPIEALKARKEWEGMDDKSDLKAIKKCQQEPSRPREAVEKTLTNGTKKKFCAV